MKLLIIGSTGQVGSALCALAKQKNIDYQAFSSAELDITRGSKVLWALRRAKPSIVINAAAYTAVDQAEDDVERCYAVNRDGVKYIARVCKRYNIPMLHISTDYVFDGKKKSAYIEEDEPHPINVYGASKLAGEQVLREGLEQHVILRVSWVFAETGNNFVKTMARVSQEREELKVVDDQRGAPTPAADIARVLVAIAQQIDSGSTAWGTYHYSGAEVTNWNEFARDIIAETRAHAPVIVKDVYSAKTADYGYRAARPLNSEMSCKKILEAYGIKQRSWKPEMARVVESYCRSQQEIQQQEK